MIAKRRYVSKLGSEIPSTVDQCLDCELPVRARRLDHRQVLYEAPGFRPGKFATGSAISANYDQGPACGESGWHTPSLTIPWPVWYGQGRS
jgi:hypothetical protein